MEAKLENLGNNKHGALQRAIGNYTRIQQKENVAVVVDEYVKSQLQQGQGKWLDVLEEELKDVHNHLQLQIV